MHGDASSMGMPMALVGMGQACCMGSGELATLATCLTMASVCRNKVPFAFRACQERTHRLQRIQVESGKRSPGATLVRHFHATDVLNKLVWSNASGALSKPYTWSHASGALSKCLKGQSTIGETGGGVCIGKHIGWSKHVTRGNEQEKGGHRLVDPA